MKSIVVFCGSSEGVNSEYGSKAYELGETFAKKTIELVYGGAKIGIMGKVAMGVLNNGGKVVGVIPVFLRKKEVVHEGLTKLIVTQNMHERKLKMHDLSDGILMLPGGFGTLEEFFEMLTWSQLGLHQYPIGILNTNGFYDSLLKMMHDMVSEGFVKQEHINTILVDEEIDALLEKMENYIPLPTPKWINKEQL
ncbi:LOG family protein [Maribacter hydrothermalis]|uniref:Cytokinin riboside 5'-monophosphate phosphoribohydrolase n=1 Tax=Maribacter hydrothermalis TaxID=1836467 RepID=A0A1B7Z8A2_9FLAO|nr:TIGR00730 family Rossman fold protein [Maribacter hydrothermalis]APQ19179.1 Rossman fold protein, TIGR00730 family [Maribacter hydrothermalis]OBR38810.1 Rossman fold protein, TIGR00730 family [Maribacter hydrothermalis]